jgi:hypothetical protein
MAFMNNDITSRSGGDKRPGDDSERTLSGREILVILTVIALVCVGGYFFLMKLIAVSQQEDCFLAQRRNCASNEPFRR